MLDYLFSRRGLLRTLFGSLCWWWLPKAPVITTTLLETTAVAESVEQQTYPAVGTRWRGSDILRWLEHVAPRRLLELAKANPIFDKYRLCSEDELYASTEAGDEVFLLSRVTSPQRELDIDFIQTWQTAPSALEDVLTSLSAELAESLAKLPDVRQVYLSVFARQEAYMLRISVYALVSYPQPPCVCFKEQDA